MRVSDLVRDREREARIFERNSAIRSAHDGNLNSVVLHPERAWIWALSRLEGAATADQRDYAQYIMGLVLQVNAHNEREGIR